ncbi:MAG: hypothetical protein M3R34_06585 [Acidobacteriota bacterium]|nr:hypothetical protein [Acidobacteriota bacterium]
MANGSGDFVVALSTANLVPHGPASGSLGRTRAPGAGLQFLTRATAVTGYRGAKAEALPIDPLKALLASES